MNASKLGAGAAIIVLAVAACSGGASSAPTAAAAAASAPGATGAAPEATATAAAPATDAAASQSLADLAAEMCSLLAPTDLKTATGATYGAGMASEFGGCSWSTTESGGGHVFASIQDATLDFIAAAFAGGTHLTIGRYPAYWLPTDSIDTMYVEISGRVLTVSMSPGNLANQAIVTKLVEVAAGRL